MTMASPQGIRRVRSKDSVRHICSKGAFPPTRIRADSRIRSRSFGAIVAPTSAHDYTQIFASDCDGGGIFGGAQYGIDRAGTT